MNQVLLSDLVKALLEKGLHPSAIRKHLQAQGIPWKYQYHRLAGNAERRRRLKQLGLKKCRSCSGTISIGFSADTCEDCLTEKWAAQ